MEKKFTVRIHLIKPVLVVLLFSSLAWISGFHGIAFVRAQDQTPSGPVYIVQEGDTLWDIALRFGVQMAELAKVNDITDPAQIAVGDQLIIPGLEGVTGVLTTINVPYGETIRSLSRRFQTSVEVLAKLNHITNPSELYIDSSLVIPQQEEAIDLNGREMLDPSHSILELAVANGTNPWAYLLQNDLPGTWGAVPGDVLHTQSESSQPENSDEGLMNPGALPDAIDSISIEPLPFVQGKAAKIHVKGDEGINLMGSFLDHEMQYFELENGEYVSLQGVHAMTEPGFYPLYLSGTLANGTPFSFSQAVYVRDGDYPYDPTLNVSPETIDPTVTRPEDAEWQALTAPVTSEKLWDGIFQSPAPPPFNDCWPSRFGNRRSYNGGEYSSFHTGLDFCGRVGTEVLAPAAGRVVFAGPLTVRGNSTVIDHGWGVYTAYMHQSEILVKPGDLVTPGQLIGLVGGTGRVTGPHLHWEVWVGGLQVDPLDWLEQVFP